MIAAISSDNGNTKLMNNLLKVIKWKCTWTILSKTALKDEH